MYIKYNDFLYENNIDSITPEELYLLNLYGIEDYKFNIDKNLIDVYQDIDINFHALSNLPKIRFGKIYGNFSCIHNVLTSLEYSPIEITGNFDCSGNKITSLKYCPRYIGGYFSCGINQLTSLEGCPKIINGTFDCIDNKLTSLKHCPKKVNGNFSCRKNKLTSLEHCPKEVDGYFYCSDNPMLYSIENYPLCFIKGSISMINNFGIIFKIVKENEEIFKNLIDDKIKFHQMIMRLRPDFIKNYKTIPPPSSNSKLLI